MDIGSDKRFNVQGFILIATYLPQESPRRFIIIHLIPDDRLDINNFTGRFPGASLRSMLPTQTYSALDFALPLS